MVRGVMPGVTMRESTELIILGWRLLLEPAVWLICGLSQCAQITRPVSVFLKWALNAAEESSGLVPSFLRVSPNSIRVTWQVEAVLELLLF